LKLRNLFYFHTHISCNTQPIALDEKLYESSFFGHDYSYTTTEGAGGDCNNKKENKRKKVRRKEIAFPFDCEKKGKEGSARLLDFCKLKQKYLSSNLFFQNLYFYFFFPSSSFCLAFFKKKQFILFFIFFTFLPFPVKSGKLGSTE